MEKRGKGGFLCSEVAAWFLEGWKKGGTRVAGWKRRGLGDEIKGGAGRFIFSTFLKTSLIISFLSTFNLTKTIPCLILSTSITRSLFLIFDSYLLARGENSTRKTDMTLKTKQASPFPISTRLSVHDVLR